MRKSTKKHASLLYRAFDVQVWLLAYNERSHNGSLGALGEAGELLHAFFNELSLMESLRKRQAEIDAENKADDKKEEEDKQETPARLWNFTNSGVAGSIAVMFREAICESQDVVKLADRLCERMMARPCTLKPLRHILRIVPLQWITEATKPALSRLLKDVLPKSPLAADAESTSFAISCRLRSVSGIDSTKDIIIFAGSHLDSKHSVNLKTPNYHLIIEGFKSTFGFSVVPHDKYILYRKYNPSLLN